VPERIRFIARTRGAFADLLRGALGTGGYERYCAHHAAHHGDTPPLDRAAWFRRREAERWTGVNRCC
jgi:uncharacterized short protein YbdD (DUF466 family)